MTICTEHLYFMPVEAGERVQSLWMCSYTVLTTWVPITDLRSSGRASSALTAEPSLQPLKTVFYANYLMIN